MAVAVPFPTEDTVDLAPPTAAEVELITRDLATGAAGPGGLTDTQRAVLNALTTSMTGFVVDVANVEPLGPDGLADALHFRNHDFRTRIIQLMLLAELLLVPLPPQVSAQVESYAQRLGVGDDIMRVARIDGPRTHRLRTQWVLPTPARSPARSSACVKRARKRMGHRVHRRRALRALARAGAVS